MTLQSDGSSNRDIFGTPPWESRDKKPFGCRFRGEAQRILYGGRWWLPPSPNCGESYESRVARGYLSTKGAPKSELTNLLVGFMQVRVSK
jgi:hypothetical protein